MRLIAALILALMLGGAAYAAFWWFSLSYNSKEMKGAVEEALGAKLSYGSPQWIPRVNAVVVRWPKPVLQMEKGPIRTVEAKYLVMVSGFFSRDRWRLELPQNVELTMANGRKMRLETKDAELVWLEESQRLSLRAGEVSFINDSGEKIGKVADVMAERRSADSGVRLNLASRPEFGSEKAVLSGQLVLPEKVMADLLAYLGDTQRPRLHDMLAVMARGLGRYGGEAVLDNISFRYGNLSGAVYGNMKVTPRGYYAGQLVLTADTAERLLGWVRQARLALPRSLPEERGWRDAQQKVDPQHPAMRIEVIPDAVLLNGYAVGPVPKVADIIEKMWP